MSKIKLNNVDLAWLRLDSPTNPMMITVVLHLKGQINYDRFIITVKDALSRYRRFRQRIVRPHKMFRRPYWEDDPSYRVEDHIERLDLQPPADGATLLELTNKIMNSALDFAHPLWKATLVDNHPDGSIIIVRLHHCIADGISLMQVLLQMTQPSPDEPGNQENAENPTPGRSGLVRKPTFLNIIAATARIIFRSPDPPTILKGRLGSIKKAVWSEPFSLPEIRKIARYKHATTNDVLMAVASGAIRRYFALHSEVRKRNIRAFIMVNLRSRSLDDELGNKFGLVFLTLPIDREQPLERLDGIKQGMDILKASAEYAATYMILNILGLLPESVERLASKILDAKGTVVATNVPGPRHPIYLAGMPITSIQAWVPQSGRIGVGVSFISYNNQVSVGLNVDARVVPDPEMLLQLFGAEFKALQAAISADTLD